jgi:zinc protease
LLVNRLLPALALALIALAAPSAVRAQSADGGIGDNGVYQTRLANGLQVVVVEDRAAPVVHTSVWYRFGSLYETPGKTGLAHALEHMMFRGTPEISAGGLDDIMARLGAQMNGQTDYDYTNYLLDMPADRVGIALQIEADRMQKLSLQPNEWAIEQRAVLNEIDGDESSPFYNLLSRVRAAAYPDLPAGRTPSGVRSDVANATVADLRKYYQEWYEPNNAALVVAGDVDHNTIFAMAKRDFGAIPKRALPAHQFTHPKAATGKVVDAEFPFPFEVLDLAYAVPGDTEPGEPAISTLSSLIPNERGPFYQALVETNVALAIEANADTQLRGGLMHIFIVLNPGHTGAEAQKVFQATMDSVLKSGFDPDLVTAAKRETLAERAYAADSIGGYGDLVGYTYGIVGERDRDEDSRLAALTSDSLLAAARTYLATPNVVGHLTPNDKPAARSSQKSDAANSDNFSDRAPNGPIVVPADIRAQLRKPTTARSKLAPVEFTLRNGLRVIVQEKRDRPTVYIGGSIASSPGFVPPGKEGISRLASAVAGFGTEHYDFTQLRKATDDIGASIDLGQRFSAHGFAHDFETLLALLADGEQHPAFPDRWLSLERSQLANSVTTEQSISGVMVDRAYMQRLLSPDDPALRYPSPSSVASITRQDLLDYTKRYWRPDLTTIAIVGDITPERARRAVEAAFGSWSNQGATPSLSQLPLPPPHTGHAYVGTDANQVFIQLGQPAVARSSRDYDTFKLLSEMLGGPGYFQSRLWQELRQKRGLVYSVSTEVKSDKDRGDLEIQLNAAPRNVAAAIAIVRDQLERLRTQPVTATELQEAKVRIVSEALLNEASASGQLDEILQIAQDHLPLDYFSTLSQRYAGITAADIQRVAKEYVEPDRLIQVYAGPSGPWANHAL